MRVRRILVVDDNAVSRELLGHILKGTCEEVIEAADGRDALEKIRTAAPDLVLLDLEIPQLDGYAVLREVRKDTSVASMRIVAVTARAMRGDREGALAAGFDGYISKPVSATIVREYVRRLKEE